MTNTTSDAATEASERPSSFGYEELLDCAHGNMFGPANGRLPLPNMLMMDRIPHISTEGGKYGKGEIKAELDIHPDLWFFACHFEGDPVMPGCLGLDAMWQLVGFFLVWLDLPGRGRALVTEPGHRPFYLARASFTEIQPPQSIEVLTQSHMNLARHIKAPLTGFIATCP